MIIWHLKKPADEVDLGGEAVAGFPMPPLILAYSCLANVMMGGGRVG